MKINTKSLHFRFNKAYLTQLSDDKYMIREDKDVLRYANNSLCDYFWGTLFRLIKYVFFLSVIGVFSSVMSYNIITEPLYMLIAQIQAGYGLFYVEEYNAIAILLAVIIGILIFIAILMCKDYMEDNSDNLVLSYIKAKKNKWCPSIELE